MGTMRTFDPDGWTPRELVSPDGRRFTPSTRAEEGELLARQYRVANPEQDTPAGGEPVAPAPEDTPAAEPAATEQLAAEVVDIAPTDEPAADAAAEPVEPVPAEAAPPKPRRTRTATQPTDTTQEQQA